MAFSPDGDKFASCGEDRHIRIFDVETCNHLRVLEGHLKEVLPIIIQLICGL